MKPMITLLALLLTGINAATMAVEPASPPAVMAAPSQAQPLVTAVASLGIVVSDLDRSIAWYRDVLDFRVIEQRESAGDDLERLTGVFGSRTLSATLQLGQEHIELVQYLAPEGRPIPIDSRSNDSWFQHIAIVVSDMPKAYARLREHRVRHASSGPQTLPETIPAAAGISAFYFKDPDGHVLEVIHFPKGKGDPRWQTFGQGDLFLGIDHTAIVVADTERSVRFYRDALGLRVAGESENFGTQQEHLNNVFGARLRITGLRAKSGPGIELLEYLAPSGGRPFPADSQLNDLWSWRTQLVTRAAADAERSLRQARAAFVSPGVVSGGLSVRDPDGHVLILSITSSHAGDPAR